MEVFIQQLINGITLGSIYGLIAIGYTMVFGIIGMVNFAHGDVFMVSAFIALITFLDRHHLARHLLGRGRARDHARRRDAADLARQLDDRAARLSAVAWIVPPRAADLGDRHVDFPREFRPGRPGTAQQVDPAAAAGRLRADVERGLPGHAVVPAIVDLGGDRGDARRVLVRGDAAPRSAAPSAPASRTRRWRRCSASMSTAPSRSPS